jgi:hypothetical protein
MSERATFWRRILADWERSGLSQAEFCWRRELKAVTFAWWKRRLRPRDESDGVRRGRVQDVERRGRADFVELALPARGGLAYELALPGGACLRLPGDFDPERVARLVQALAAACWADSGTL